MGDEAWFVIRQVFSKDIVCVTRHTNVNDVAGKVRSRDQLWIVDILQRALIGVFDPHFGQFSGHFFGAVVTSRARFAQPLDQAGVVRVKSQANNVDGDACKTD